VRQKVICCHLNNVGGQHCRVVSVDKKKSLRRATNRGARLANDTTNNCHYNPENPWQISPGLSVGKKMIHCHPNDVGGQNCRAPSVDITKSL
jgi:hypothetical protein